MSKIFKNGKIFSFDKVYNQMEIDGELITYLGDNKECEDYIDLDGKMVIPLILDSHSHFISYALSLLKLDLSSYKNIGEILDSIRGYIKDNKMPKGSYLRMYNFDQNNIEEKRFINLNDLKEFNDYYVVIEHVSSHMGIFNKRLLDEYKVESNDGLLIENSYVELLKKLPMDKIEDIVRVFKKANELYHSQGIGVFQEGMMTRELLPLYKYLMSLNIIQNPIYGYPTIDCYKEYKEAFKDDKYLKIQGIKLILDGSPQGKSAYMKEKYLHDDTYGEFTSTLEDIRRNIEFVIENDIQLLVHCNGNKAIRILLDALNEYKEEVRKLKYRPVLIHCQLIDKEDLDLVKDLNLVISYFVSHVYYWGDVHLYNFGEKANYISPLKTSIDKGIVTTIHNDTPVLKPNLIESIFIAHNRVSKNGKVLGKEESIDLVEALKNITKNVSYQYNDDKYIGDLKVGKSASFAILNTSELREDSKVESLYIDGKKVY